MREVRPATIVPSDYHRSIPPILGESSSAGAQSRAARRETFRDPIKRGSAPASTAFTIKAKSHPAVEYNCARHICGI